MRKKYIQLLKNSRRSLKLHNEICMANNTVHLLSACAENCPQPEFLFLTAHHRHNESYNKQELFTLDKDVNACFSNTMMLSPLPCDIASS